MLEGKGRVWQTGVVGREGHRSENGAGSLQASRHGRHGGEEQACIDMNSRIEGGDKGKGVVAVRAGTW